MPTTKELSRIRIFKKDGDQRKLYAEAILEQEVQKQAPSSNRVGTAAARAGRSFSSHAATLERPSATSHTHAA
jgi:hypothetical protein